MLNDLKRFFMKANGGIKGVYSIEGEVKNWLKEQLDFA